MQNIFSHYPCDTTQYITDLESKDFSRILVPNAVGEKCIFFGIIHYVHLNSARKKKITILF